MEAGAQRLVVHRHVGATALRVGDGSLISALVYLATRDRSQHAYAAGELDLTGAADQAFVMIFTNRADDGWFPHFCLSHRC
jgi:hypothetical protein